jgi:hypothetical protein
MRGRPDRSDDSTAKKPPDPLRRLFFGTARKQIEPSNQAEGNKNIKPN